MPVNNCSATTPIFSDVVVGDTVTWNFSLKDSVGDPIDLTGYEITITFKEKLSDAVALYEDTQDDTEFADTVNGELSFTIEETETATWPAPRKLHVDVVMVNTANDDRTTLILTTLNTKVGVKNIA